MKDEEEIYRDTLLAPALPGKIARRKYVPEGYAEADNLFRTADMKNPQGSIFCFDRHEPQDKNSIHLGELLLSRFVLEVSDGMSRCLWCLLYGNFNFIANPWPSAWKTGEYALYSA